MKTVEPTLRQRAGRLHRQLLLLQRLFQSSSEVEDVEWLGTGDKARDLGLCAGVRESLDELTEHARILTTVPSPLNEWRPGDGADDERWRALTEVERREVLSMVSGYESLIAWSEGLANGNGGGLQAALAPHELREATDYLAAERSRVGRFRQEMGFLERRRIAGA